MTRKRRRQLLDAHVHGEETVTTFIRYEENDDRGFDDTLHMDQKQSLGISRMEKRRQLRSISMLGRRSITTTLARRGQDDHSTHST